MEKHITKISQTIEPNNSEISETSVNQIRRNNPAEKIRASATICKEKILQIWKLESIHTFHPFRAIHAPKFFPRTFLQYLNRFSLELIIISIAIFSFYINFYSSHHAEGFVSSDKSVMFSFIQKHPDYNRSLLATAASITIDSQMDRQIYSNHDITGTAVLTANSFNKPNIVSLTAVQDASIIKTNPSDSENFSRHGVTIYEVRSGDSIISIASEFGVSPQTIMLENKIDETTTIKPGQKLNILPATGISHEVKDVDSLESIAKKYIKPGMEQEQFMEDILDANDIELEGDITTGDILAIPLPSVDMPIKPKLASKFVKNDSNKVALKQSAAPEGFAGSGNLSFIWPTSVRSITQGFWSRHTGLDISNSQRVPIYASEEGYVEISGYQAGYGNTIVINHGNGFKTRYGHATELYVSAGEFVQKGQTIAKQGNTGRVRGVTGIHLHFEIIKNGKRVSPLSYVKP